MSMAVIYYHDGHMQRLGDADKALALEAYHALRQKDPVATETVRRVVLPPSWRPGSYASQEAPTQATVLFHEGIAQGKNSALPAGDRD